MCPSIRVHDLREYSRDAVRRVPHTATVQLFASERTATLSANDPTVSECLDLTYSLHLYIVEYRVPPTQPYLTSWFRCVVPWERTHAPD